MLRTNIKNEFLGDVPRPGSLEVHQTQILVVLYKVSKPLCYHTVSHGNLLQSLLTLKICLMRTVQTHHDWWDVLRKWLSTRAPELCRSDFGFEHLTCRVASVSGSIGSRIAEGWETLSSRLTSSRLNESGVANERQYSSTIIFHPLERFVVLSP